MHGTTTLCKKLLMSHFNTNLKKTAIIISSIYNVSASTPMYCWPMHELPLLFFMHLVKKFLASAHFTHFVHLGIQGWSYKICYMALTDGFNITSHKSWYCVKTLQK